jgi:uncharacterized protein (DUF4415 family)
MPKRVPQSGLYQREKQTKWKGGVTMAIIRSTVKAGQKPSKEEIRRICEELREARKYPIVYTEDCPESSPEVLKEFAELAAERNRRKRRQAVTIRLVPDCLSKYKALGKGYTGVMADILAYAADNPDILFKMTHDQKSEG